MATPKKIKQNTKYTHLIGFSIWFLPLLIESAKNKNVSKIKPSIIKPFTVGDIILIVFKKEFHTSHIRLIILHIPRN